MIFVKGVRRDLGIILVEGIVGVTWVELVARIRRVAGIVRIDGIQRILRIVGVDRIQRTAQSILIARIEDVVVPLVLFAKPWIGKRGNGEEEETETPDYPHGKPPTSGTAGEKSLLPS